MAHKLKLPGAFKKAGGGWPIQWGSGGFVRNGLADRAEHAIRHLAKTPRGAFWADLDYGTMFHVILTQSHPVSGTDSDGGLPGSLEAANSEFVSSAEEYVPDAEILDTEVSPEPGTRSVIFKHTWSFNGDRLVSPGASAKPRSVTTVI